MQLSSERPHLPQSETAVPPAISVRPGLDRHPGRFDKIFLSILAISIAAISLSFLLFRYDSSVQLASAIGATATCLAALSVALHSKMRTYSFTTWVICFVVVGFLYPKTFLELGPIKGVAILSYLIQIAMFGMGATLTFQDFSRILRTPKPVACLRLNEPSA